MMFYIIGCIFAFVLGTQEAKEEYEKGNNLDEFESGIVFVTLLSWVYVVIYIYKHYNR